MFKGIIHIRERWQRGRIKQPEFHFSQTEKTTSAHGYGGISLKRTSYSIEATSRGLNSLKSTSSLRLSAAFTVGLGFVPGVTGWTGHRRNVRGHSKLTSCSTCPGSSSTSCWTQNTSLDPFTKSTIDLNHQKAYDSQKNEQICSIKVGPFHDTCSHWGTWLRVSPSRK